MPPKKKERKPGKPAGKSSPPAKAVYVNLDGIEDKKKGRKTPARAA